MTEPNDKNELQQRPTMAVDIERHMQRKKEMKAKNLDFSQIKKLTALSFVIVSDPIAQSRVFGWVSFEGISFIFFEESIKEIPAEKGINIGYRMNVAMYEIRPIKQDYINALTQDKVTGGVFVTLHDEINKLSREKWGVPLDSLLTTLNGMIILGLVESEQGDLLSLDDSREIAAQITPDRIKRAAWLALRKREARYLIERENIAINS